MVLLLAYEKYTVIDGLPGLVLTNFGFINAGNFSERALHDNAGQRTGGSTRGFCLGYTFTHI
jgi:hypothetical protein